MASLTMMTSLLGGATVADRPSVSHRRRSLVVVAKAAARVDAGELDWEGARGGDSGRRAVMFAAAASAVCAVGRGIAMADEEEPKPGTPEAKKKYARICVTMPTAKICHK